MNKKELALLGKAYDIEIGSALGGHDSMLQTKSKLAEKLVADGLLVSHTIKHGGALPIVSHGYLLTNLGRMSYCMSCDDTAEVIA